MKVVIRTGQVQDDKDRALLDEGVLAWVEKPPVVKDLANLVGKAVAGNE